MMPPTRKSTWVTGTAHFAKPSDVENAFQTSGTGASITAEHSCTPPSRKDESVTGPAAKAAPVRPK